MTYFISQPGLWGDSGAGSLKAGFFRRFPAGSRSDLLLTAWPRSLPAVWPGPSLCRERGAWRCLPSGPPSGPQLWEPLLPGADEETEAWSGDNNRVAHIPICSCRSWGEEEPVCSESETISSREKAAGSWRSLSPGCCARVYTPVFLGWPVHTCLGMHMWPRCMHLSTHL